MTTTAKADSAQFRRPSRRDVLILGSAASVAASSISMAYASQLSSGDDDVAADIKLSRLHEKWQRLEAEYHAAMAAEKEARARIQAQLPKRPRETFGDYWTQERLERVRRFVQGAMDAGNAWVGPHMPEIEKAEKALAHYESEVRRLNAKERLFQLEADALRLMESCFGAFAAFMQEPTDTAYGMHLKLSTVFADNERRYQSALAEPALTDEDDVAIAHVLRDLSRMAAGTSLNTERA